MRPYAMYEVVLSILSKPSSHKYNLSRSLCQVVFRVFAEQNKEQKIDNRYYNSFYSVCEQFVKTPLFAFGLNHLLCRDLVDLGTVHDVGGPKI